MYKKGPMDRFMSRCFPAGPVPSPPSSCPSFPRLAKFCSRPRVAHSLRLGPRQAPLPSQFQPTRRRRCHGLPCVAMCSPSLSFPFLSFPSLPFPSHPFPSPDVASRSCSLHRVSFLPWWVRASPPLVSCSVLAQREKESGQIAHCVPHSLALAFPTSTCFATLGSPHHSYYVKVPTYFVPTVVNHTRWGRVFVCFFFRVAPVSAR
ncbi:hypothetical protein LX32DRAFT_49985 [Colletotrichum zoysiae]|uniref:Uncharacterized protein n=1 Tax=Colletotrichum zoysiae TaxID=1216348 RepID=A0AAD9LX58_9PEZI|nr:hypothetical protein LX32DRAFT_49985 [Colletotrichum zoysiae]